jgi:hypothetical protein
LKGQSSIEFLVILAFSLLAFASIIFFANSRAGGISALMNEQQAAGSIELLAGSAKEVFIQGNGAGKALLLKLPENIDENHSGISNNSIIYSVKGVFFSKKLEFPIEGTLPKSSGWNVVRISSSNGIVSFAPSRVFLSKASFFVQLKKGSGLQDSIVFRNYSKENVFVSLKKQLSSEGISLSFSRQEFDLNSAVPETISLFFSSKPTSIGNYSGKITAIVKAENYSEVLEIPLLFEVSETGVLSAFPSFVSGSFAKGTAYSKSISLCNNSQSVLSGIEFQASQGQPGEWFSQLEGIAELQPGCTGVELNFFIPSNASGIYPGFLTFSDGLNTAGIDLNLNVEGG